MWLFGGTEAERKRDEYKRLHGKLEDALTDHNKYIKDIQAAINGYQAAIPALSSDKIPSDDFEPKREEKTALLNKYFEYEKSKTSDLTNAKNTAYEKYLHYKRIAEEEARARHKAMMDKIESFIGGITGGR
ncbi:hypothetical protein QR721_11720 [Aciduricibacillus chroicocephali]|uniref:Uncharacterized protein n=1 Tax=Aciduricibacillus chroicocephali TaxID=3054939 RepID=A0ABY9KU40_9BACI|nr:hypothetical protein QR721_11720 [Bacillaceae bacterium 44XB]